MSVDAMEIRGAGCEKLLVVTATGDVFLRGALVGNDPELAAVLMEQGRMLLALRSATESLVAALSLDTVP